MVGRGRTWARIRGVAVLAFALVAVTASAQLDRRNSDAQCAENRQAIGVLEAQRANGGRVDLSMARSELDTMRAHAKRIEQIEALRATGSLLGRMSLDQADQQLESEKQAIAASARKYDVTCINLYSDDFETKCVAKFEQMMRRAAAAPPPDPQAVERLIAAYRGNLAALRCGDTGAKPAPQTASNPGPGCHGFTGKWNTNYGPMWLVANGGSITGFYDWVGSAGPRHDTLTGTVTGNVAEGRYSQPGYPNPEYESGRFRFELHGNSFSGAGWSRSGGSSLGWSGTCATP